MTADTGGAAWYPWKVIAIILLYWFVSMSMVFANKHLVGNSQSTEDMTLFIAWYQCCVVVVAILTMAKVSRWMGWSSRQSLVSARLLTHRNIIVLSLTFVTGLVFNSLMLKHIGVAFYQVARSSTLVFVVILSHFLLGKFINFKIGLCCLVVVLGYYLGASEEGEHEEIPFMGICYGLAASFVIALGGTFMKKSEELTNRDSLKLTFCYNFNSCFILVTLLLSTGQFQVVANSDRITDPWFWVLLNISGFLSLFIGLTSALQIQVTSPTTHHISINAKSVTQTVIAVLYFHQTKTVLWWVGNFLTIFGTVGYAVVKINEVGKNHEIEITPTEKKNFLVKIQPSTSPDSSKT